MYINKADSTPFMIIATYGVLYFSCFRLRAAGACPIAAIPYTKLEEVNKRVHSKPIADTDDANATQSPGGRK